jgi:hypothetical protein
MGSTLDPEELDRLKAYIGKEITLEVLCTDTTWDYGDATHEVSTVAYSIILDEITESHLKGRLTADQCWGEYGQVVKKGEPITQQYQCHIPEMGAWMGDGSRIIAKIICNSKILYPLPGSRSEHL